MNVVTPDPRFRSVGIYVSAKTRDILLAVTARLKADHGAVIHLYTRGPEEARFFENYAGEKTWSSVTDAARLPTAIRAGDIDEAATIERARAFEALIGRTIAELSFSHRHLGRGYYLGGFRHPHAATYDRASNLQTLHAYVSQLAFWESEIERRGLTLLIQVDNAAQAIAAVRAVPTRFLIGSRYGSRWIWSSDQYQNNPLLADAWERARPDPSLSVETTHVANVAKANDFADWTDIRRLFYYTAHAAASMSWWRLRGYQKGRAYDFWDYVSWPLRQYLGLRAAQKYFNVPLATLRGRQFVYFPLHKEPEESFLLRSPEYFSQHAAIASLSRSLPAGVLLAIKENHYAVARRPRDFYDQISALKNVVLLDMAEVGIECVRRCAAVAVITGSGGIEGAAMGKPVVTFSRHMPVEMVPHVQVIRDEAELPAVLRRALAPDFDSERAKADGTRFLSALVDASFDLGQFHFDAPGKVTIQPAWLDAAVDGLMRTLDENAAITEKLEFRRKAV